MSTASRLRLLALFLSGLAVTASAAGAEPRQKPKGEPASSRALRAESSKPPPPPPVVFREEPEVILIPKTRVYYVPDLKYDLFRYGRHWYINSGGNWYRARAYSGPYEYLDNERVPSTILRLPGKYHQQPTRPASGSN